MLPGSGVQVRWSPGTHSETCVAYCLSHNTVYSYNDLLGVGMASFHKACHMHVVSMITMQVWWRAMLPRLPPRSW